MSEAEDAALRERAQAEGVSIQDAARRAVREYVARELRSLAWLAAWATPAPALRTE